MDEDHSETDTSAMATLVRRAGDPLPADIRRRILTTLEGQLAGDPLVDTFDDITPEDASSLAPARSPVRRHRWLLASAAAVMAAVGVGWVVGVSDRGDASRATSPEQSAPTTADAVRRRSVSRVSTASPTGELSVARRMALPDQRSDVVSSQFLPDGRLLRWSTMEGGEVVTLYSRWAGAAMETVLPKGSAVAGAGDRMMRDVAVGPDDVLYTSYLTSVRGGWHFDLVAYSFERQPRELGRWPADWTCAGNCGDVVLATDGVVIDDDGGYIKYVDPVTGVPSGKRQYYVAEPVRASYEATRFAGRSGLHATISHGDETWTLEIDGIPLPAVADQQPLELQPQRDGSLLGVVFGQGDGEHPFYVLRLRPGGDAELYGLDDFLIPRQLYSVLGGGSIMAVGLDRDGRDELVRLAVD